MANGDQWDTINEIRRDITSIKANGCAHKEGQDRAVRDLRTDFKEFRHATDTATENIWSAIDRERGAREGMVKQIVIGVLITVVAGVVLNMVAMVVMLPRIMGH